ncbi:MAG: DNA translocase FtsK [Vicingaceae bacterium]
MGRNTFKKQDNQQQKSKSSKFSLKFKLPVLSPKAKQIIGLLFILFSFFLFISFSSFLFTWKVDYDKLFLSWQEILFNPEIKVENWLGKLGAIISNFFIYDWFGIASFSFVLISFLLGIKFLFNISLLPLKKTIKQTVFVLFFLSVTLSYLFSYPILGGGFGYHFNQWLISIIGVTGTATLLGFTLLAYILINFNINLSTLFSKNTTDEFLDENLNDEFEENSDAINEENNSEEGVIENLNEVDEPIENKEIINEDVTSAIELTTENTLEEENKNDTNEGVGFEVEVSEEKEQILTDDAINKKLEEFGEYDPTLDLSQYQLPSIDLLKQYGSGEIKVNQEELEANKNRIVGTLENYNIKIQSIKATIGPTVTLYEIIPAPGIRISKIKNLEDDIALSLSALGIRIIAPIPGKGTIGIEVPNQHPDIVSMRSVIASEKFQNAKMELPIVMGKTISNETFVFDLTKMPHLLMAGATGQGKSVGLNAVLTSLVYKKHPSQLKLVLVDPKKVELTLYNKLERHFLAKLPDSDEPIITDTKKVINTLNSLCIEMDQRYDLLKDAEVRTIVEYNKKFISRKLNPNDGHRYLPYIVLVIDEFADLIMTAGKEVEQPIARLAQLARAIGIHLIIATQRPSTNIITGTIKANFPGRIAFRVTSQIDSRTILDAGGAEQLIGRGDMLLSQGSNLIRLQCAFVDTPEVEKICEFIGSQRGYPDAFNLPEYVGESVGEAGMLDTEDKDDLFEEAARVIVQHQQGSASLLQRKLKLGYNRAGRIIDQLEAAGIVGPFEGSKARQVLYTDLESLEQYLNELNGN